MEGNLSTNVTDQLARFFEETSYGALPPEVIHEAKRSIVDGIGVALGGADHASAGILLKYCRALDGTARKAQFSDARVNDPAAVALRRKVILIPDDSIRKDEGSVAVSLKDGSRRELHIPRASGTVENPLSDEALAEKFLDLATPLIGPRSRQVLDLVWSLDRLADAARVPLLLRAS